METYEKYIIINEHIESLKLDTEAVLHYRDMFERLMSLRDREGNGPLTEEELREKETIVADLESFIRNFVQTKKVDIEKKINSFKAHTEKFTRRINEIVAEFTLGHEFNLGINEIINELHNDLKEIIDASKELIREIDEWKAYFAAYTDDALLTLDYSDINEIINEFKLKLKDIKQHQIDLYNIKVVSINDKIAEFRNMDGLNPEVQAKVARLYNISICEYTVTKWDNLSYINMLEYSKIFEINELIIEIQNDLEIEEDKIKDDLDSDIEWIEKRISELEDRINPNMTEEEISKIMIDISDIANRITGFDIKLHNNKDKINEEKFDEYFARLNDAQANLADLNEKLKNIEKLDDKSNDYKELMDKLEKLDEKVYSFSSIVEAIYGQITEEAVKRLESNLVNFESSLDSIRKEIEDKYKEGKLDENQYQNLNKKVEEIEKNLTDTRNKLREPGMIKDADIFSYLNGRVDGLEKALDVLESEVESLEKPIKDKTTRKRIDASIKRLENEIKYLENLLENNKEENEEKYEELKERLDNAKKRLDKISKKYRSKCPLHIRAYKSAKDFFKKHKKAALIIAGLAAIALLHATLGPVLIPAIMHGNMMIASTSPLLKGFALFSNNVLGGLIGATPLGATGVPAFWQLANGTLLGPSAAATSLLKGIAISGIGSTIMIAPVIVAVKKLIEKMKKADLKQKLQEEQEKIKKKLKVKKVKPKKKTKKSDRLVIEELAKLVVDFRKSGKTIDEFCEENELSEDEKMLLKSLIEKSEEKANEQAERKDRRR